MCEFCHRIHGVIETTYGEYETVLYDLHAMWGSMLYFRDGKFVFSADASNRWEVPCPCCGKCVSQMHGTPDHPAEHMTGELCPISDVSELDFGMLLELLADPGERSKDTDPHWADSSTVCYTIVSKKDTPECAEIEITTKMIDGNSVVLECFVSWDIVRWGQRFAYYLLICPNEPETVGVVWVEWNRETTIPVRFYRARIPASQISQLPTFIAPQESPTRA